jgi:gliding motility-associated-like protein
MKNFVLLFFLVTARMAVAQTCTGGLGPPIIHADFGQGFGFGPALGNGITNLSYVQNTCPEDGQYTITNYSGACFNSTWVVLGQDHTGNQAGRFMLINADYKPSDFYVQTVIGLCPGTSYQFSAWVQNVSAEPGQILPNITFRIENTDGTVLATYTTGDVVYQSPAKWVQYAVYFTIPPGVSSVVLRMTNNAAGGIGNDFALDDIQFRAAGPAIIPTAEGYPTDTIPLCYHDQPVVRINADVENCYVSQQLQWQESGDSGKTWKDIPGEVSTTLLRGATPAGFYLYRLVAAQAGNLGTSCEVFSNPIAISVIPDALPAVSIASAYPAICLGLPTQFTATPVDGGTAPQYQWMVNGVPAGTDSFGFTAVSLLGGEAVVCTMTSNAACAQNPTVVSNTLSLPGVAVPVQHVGIDASAIAICQDSLVLFTAKPDNGGASPGYQWKVNGVNAGVGPTLSDAGLNNGDVVNCIMTGSLTCSQPVEADPGVTMTVYPLPVVVLDSVVVIAGGSGVRLLPQITGDVATYSWTPVAGLDNPTAATVVASPGSTTEYRLYVVTNEGCHSTASELVEVYYPLKMPGAFSPNGDGRNDVFRVPASFPVAMRYLAVYNRAGARMFYTANAGAGWDGRFNGLSQPAGTYVWELEFENPLTKKVEKRMGTVVLIR